MKYWLVVSLLFFSVACSESESEDAKDEDKQEETEETSSQQQNEETKYYANSEADLTIEGMSCEINCVNTVKKALGKVEGVTHVAIDFDTERNEDFCKVEFDEQMLNVQNLQSIIESVNDGAYKVTQSESKKLETEDEKESAFNFDSPSSNDRINTTSSSFSLPSILDFVVALF